jgi:hypothetical protein
MTLRICFRLFRLALAIFLKKKKIPMPKRSEMRARINAEFVYHTLFSTELYLRSPTPLHVVVLYVQLIFIPILARIKPEPVFPSSRYIHQGTRGYFYWGKFAWLLGTPGVPLCSFVTRDMNKSEPLNIASYTPTLHSDVSRLFPNLLLQDDLQILCKSVS